MVERQLNLKMEKVRKIVRVNLKAQVEDALADLEETYIRSAGEAHALGLRHADPRKEGMYEGARRAFIKSAQLVRELRRELTPRVRDAMSRR